MACNSYNSSNVPNGCKNNEYCLTPRCNEIELHLEIVNEIISSNKNGINISMSSILKTKKNKNRVEIHDKIDRFDNIHI